MQVGAITANKGPTKVLTFVLQAQGQDDVVVNRLIVAICQGFRDINGNGEAAMGC